MLRKTNRNKQLHGIAKKSYCASGDRLPRAVQDRTYLTVNKPEITHETDRSSTKYVKPHAKEHT